jgi:hypothetical protein
LMFIHLYFGVLGHLYSKDRREWWDLSREEKDELLRKYVPTDSCEGTFPEGWFDLEDWEKKAILDKNLDDYYKDEAKKEFDFNEIPKHQECKQSQWGRGCVIV